MRLQVGPGKVLVLPLEEYLVGVVAAEMPASFHLEALKAQAVVARTYALRRLLSPRVDNTHPGAHLCADPSHCQAWIGRGEMRRRWGMWNFYRYSEKVARAVRETAGKVLVYQGELADPVYHASCGGRRTEDAAAVWGYEVPYLKSVPCPWDPPERHRQVPYVYSLRELLARLGREGEAVPASSRAQLVEVVGKTQSNRVRAVRVGEVSYPGPEFRKRLGLPSTDFEVKTSGDKVLFLARGKGHAVGMCQYGAQGLALRGARYFEILAYYYRGTKLADLQNSTGTLTFP